MYRLIRSSIAVVFVALMCAVIVGALVVVYMLANWVLM